RKRGSARSNANSSSTRSCPAPPMDRKNAPYLLHHWLEIGSTDRNVRVACGDVKFTCLAFCAPRPCLWPTERSHRKFDRTLYPWYTRCAWQDRNWSDGEQNVRLLHAGRLSRSRCGNAKSRWILPYPEKGSIVQREGRAPAGHGPGGTIYHPHRQNALRPDRKCTHGSYSAVCRLRRLRRVSNNGKAPKIPPPSVFVGQGRGRSRSHHNISSVARPKIGAADRFSWRVIQ